MPLPPTPVQSKLLDCFELSTASSLFCWCARFQNVRTITYDIRIRNVIKAPKNIGDNCNAPLSTAILDKNKTEITHNLLNAGNIIWGNIFYGIIWNTYQTHDDLDRRLQNLLI